MYLRIFIFYLIFAYYLLIYFFDLLEDIITYVRGTDDINRLMMLELATREILLLSHHVKLILQLFQGEDRVSA